MGDVEIEKKKFRCSKKAIDVNKVDIKKSLVSGEFAYDENKEKDAKYLIGYKSGKKIDHYPPRFHKPVDTPVKSENPVHVSELIWKGSGTS